VTQRIAINGAGIAGTTLAYWLARLGHDVLLVESAPRLRTGGYVIDFWGVGYDVAEKMGLREPLHAGGYAFDEVRFVNARGRRIGGFRVDVLRDMLQGRFTSVRRADLAALIHGRLPGGVQTRFGDSIAGLEAHPQGVHVRFEHAAPAMMDLVIGADGLHSRVRELVFGSVAAEVGLGYHVAAFEGRGYRPRDESTSVMYSVPGRQVSRLALRDDLTLFLFVLRDEYLPRTPALDDAARKRALWQAFGDAGWECRQILDALDRTDDLYFDRVSQIRLPHWSDGRVALVGDAAAAVSLLAGEGTGLAMAEAYVLACELQRAGGDHRAAYARYDAQLRPLLQRKQAAAERFASTFAPRTALGITARNAITGLLRVPWLARRLLGGPLRDDFELPPAPC
jgi:2-polyprenyl-6-methoxyphenol hydroxylase-like FAD-dependent oxidoreductase